MSVSRFTVALLVGAVSLAAGMAPALGQRDLSVEVTLADARAEIGEPILATVAVRNEGSVDRAGLRVVLRPTPALFFVELDAVGAGSFDDVALAYDLPALAAGQRDSVRVVLQASTGGTHGLTAELMRADGEDWDSVPANGRAAEDDQDAACLSVPVALDCGQDITLRAPSGYAAYAWYRDGELLVNSTADTIQPLSSGAYEYRLDGDACASGNCCPVVLERGGCIDDLALVATAEPGDDGLQRVTLRVYNEGGGAVSSFRLYVTASRYMRLRPGSTGWTLAGTRMKTEWSGYLVPGDSADVVFELQTVPGGQPRDYRVFAEIYEFYAGADRLADHDSSPDLDPTNDRVVDDGRGLDPALDEDDSDVADLSVCPVATVEGGEQLYCVGDPVRLRATSTDPDATFTWTVSAGVSLSCSDCAETELDAAVEGAVATIRVESSDGCLSEERIELRVRDCVSAVRVVAAPWRSGEACLQLDDTERMAWCDGAFATGVASTQRANGPESCMTVTTTGAWGGVRETCLTVCAPVGGGSVEEACREVQVRIVGHPRRDTVRVGPGEEFCLDAVLQVAGRAQNHAAAASGAVRLERTGLRCFTAVDHGGVRDDVALDVISTYEILGEALADTTVFIVEGRAACALVGLATDALEVEADESSQVTVAGTTVCMEGAYATLSTADFRLASGQALEPLGGCRPATYAEYVLAPGQLPDDGWFLDRVLVDGVNRARGSYFASLTDLAGAVETAARLPSTYDAVERRLRVSASDAQLGLLQLRHAATQQTLRFSPQTIDGFAGVELAIPAGIDPDGYEIVVTSALGCEARVPLVVTPGVSFVLQLDTTYVEVGTGQPVVFCLEGAQAPSPTWRDLGGGCFRASFDAAGETREHLFVALDGSRKIEHSLFVSTGPMPCIDVAVASSVSRRAGFGCGFTSAPLGLIAANVDVQSAGARVSSLDRPTGQRPGSRYGLQVLPHHGLAQRFRVAEWPGLPALSGTAGSLAELERAARGLGQQVFVDWTTGTMSIPGTGLSALRLTFDGQAFTVEAEGDSLPTYGLVTAAGGRYTVSATHGGCRAELTYSVTCPTIVRLPDSGVAGTLGVRGSTDLGRAGLPTDGEVAIERAGASLEASLGGEPLTLTYLSNEVGVDSVTLKSCLADGSCTYLTVVVTTTAASTPCAVDIWRGEDERLVAPAGGRGIRYPMPADFDPERHALLLDGRRVPPAGLRVGDVARGYALDPSGGETPSSLLDLATGREMAWGSEELQAVLANATAVPRLLGRNALGIWEPVGTRAKATEPGYALVLTPGKHTLRVEGHQASACAQEHTVHVAAPGLQTVADEVELAVGELARYCLPAARRGARVLSVENRCGEASGESVATFVEGACVDLEAFEPGEETLCLVRRYADGGVDSIALTVYVEAPVRMSTTDDRDTIEFGQFKVFEVLANDKLADEPRMVSLISEPFFGRAQVVGNSAIEYLHYGSDCAVDVFTYEVCQGEVCDSATVQVDVYCDDLLVYNGFSPNGDGVNDEFTVLGLGQYPGHEIQIFNRQGNLLVVLRDYESDWRGEVGGRALPEGTYFYVIDLGDGQAESGYLQLSR